MSDADWQQRAAERITAHRRAEIAVRLTHQGRPAAGAEIAVEQVSGSMRCGTCVGRALHRDDAVGERHRAFVRQTCDVLVCENAMKWYAIEAEAGQIDWAEADATMAFAQAHGIALRGHCLTWSKEKFVQPWVRALAPEALRPAVEAHVRRVVERYRGRLLAWDGNNEMLDGRWYRDRLGEDFPAWLYALAHECDPAAPVFVNEYGILDDDERLQHYLDLIAAIQAAGGPVGGIGIQEHACERCAPDHVAAAADADRPERQGRKALIPEEVWARCDRLAATGLPLHITEVSCKTDDEQRRARSLDLFLHTAFAHPAVEAFLIWGFDAAHHWLGRPAALMDADGHLTPAGEIWVERTTRTWRSSCRCRADEAGIIRFNGFRGSYRLTALGDGLQADCDCRVPGAVVEAALTTAL